MAEEPIKSSRASFEQIDRVRKYPRVILDQSALLGLPGNMTVPVKLHDLSICGIQICFDEHSEQTISTVLQSKDISELSWLEVSFKLRLGDWEEEIIVRCKPVRIGKCGHDEFAMGMFYMLFTDVEERYQALIKDFIEFSMEPQ